MPRNGALLRACLVKELNEKIDETRKFKHPWAIYLSTFHLPVFILIIIVFGFPMGVEFSHAILR